MLFDAGSIRSWHAKPIGNHLRMAGLVALPMRQRAGDDRDFAIGVQRAIPTSLRDPGVVNTLVSTMLRPRHLPTASLAARRVASPFQSARSWISDRPA